MHTKHRRRLPLFKTLTDFLGRSLHVKKYDGEEETCKNLQNWKFEASACLLSEKEENKCWNNLLRHMFSRLKLVYGNMKSTAAAAFDFTDERSRFWEGRGKPGEWMWYNSMFASHFLSHIYYDYMKSHF